MPANTSAAPSPLLERIATQHLRVPTLLTRRSDSLDFHECSVWGLERALQAAFDAGVAAGRAQA